MLIVRNLCEEQPKKIELPTSGCRRVVAAYPKRSRNPARRRAHARHGKRWVRGRRPILIAAVPRLVLEERGCPRLLSLEPEEEAGEEADHGEAADDAAYDRTDYVGVAAGGAGCGAGEGR